MLELVLFSALVTVVITSGGEYAESECERIFMEMLKIINVALNSPTRLNKFPLVFNRIQSVVMIPVVIGE